VKKVLICALALGGFAASAQAADLGVDSLKDPLPDTLTYKGVTIYGTIDVGYAYQTNGAPYSGSLYTGLDYNMYGSKQNRESISTLTNNALSQSVIGVKVEEAVGLGFVALGRLDTGFNPLSGEIADACASMVRDNGKPLTQAISAGDGSRCGQAINGQAYAGLSHSTYGTLTIGRQNSLDLDVMSNYDPMGMSYSMSLIGWSGGAGPGVGMTETARWDNSLKYLFQYGPVHAGFMFADGSSDSSLQGNSYAGNLGATWRGLSVDVVYTKEVDGIYINGPYPYTGACPGGNCDVLTGVVANSEAWTVAGKYVYEFGGGFKDEGPSSKLTLFAGYQHADLSNPSDTNTALYTTTLNGYQLTGMVTNKYITDRINQTEWAGVKYETGPWALTAAYYHLGLDFYQTAGSLVSCSSSAHSNCAGDTNTVSGLIDYSFNKHFDVYTGVSWSNVSGGLANGFSGTSGAGNGNPGHVVVGSDENTTVVTGMRLKF
jgi:predicted porin